MSVPNEGTNSSETTFLSLKAETASSRHDYAGNIESRALLFSLL